MEAEPHTPKKTYERIFASIIVILLLYFYLLAERYSLCDDRNVK